MKNVANTPLAMMVFIGAISMRTSVLRVLPMRIPSLQRFFLTHKEINVAEFARSIGMNATLLRNYINGFKKPSAEREREILAHIHRLGKDMIAACF